MRKRVDELFNDALEVDPSQRKVFLDEACAGDTKLRERVEAMLKGFEQMGSFLAPSTDVMTSMMAGPGPLPSMIGNYRVLRTLGEGGMGKVYEAEQLRPVRRRVAIKLIKHGLHSKEVLARFESERQALALMSHSGIAKVLDAGATEEGLPYFVMEFVSGVAISDYCDRHRASIEERLQLFVGVCDAIHHAHQRGIIHRDIKPSNILIEIQDDKQVPKVIDFGVAKAIHHRLTEQTLFTEFGQLIGTPEYMSPEQSDPTALDVDIRTDVYSLGVLLYEIMVGHPPLDLREVRKKGLFEVQRAIREDDPPRPSWRVRHAGEEAPTLSRNRRTTVRALAKQLHGDIDWIIMKALEKDRVRRYGTVSDLAEDVRRYLRNDAVLARPPSINYRFRKFVRRNTGAVVAGMGILAGLVFGLVAVTIGLVQAKRAEQHAQYEAATSRRVSMFLESLFDLDRSEVNNPNDVTARQLLDAGAAQVREDLDENPLVRARFMNAIAGGYRKLGHPDRAMPLTELALTLQEEALGSDHLEVAATRNLLALLQSTMGDYDSARQNYERVLEVREAQLTSDHSDLQATRNSLANLLSELGEYEAAMPLYQNVLTTMTAKLGPEHIDVARTMANLSTLMYQAGEREPAIEMYLRAHAVFEDALGPDHFQVAGSSYNLASMKYGVGDYEGARSLFERSMAALEKTLGPLHPALGSCSVNLALTLARLQDSVAAEELFQRALSIWQGAGYRDPDNSYAEACYLSVVGRSDDAMVALEAAIDLGFSDRHRLMQDPDLESLRIRPDFASLADRIGS